MDEIINEYLLEMGCTEINPVYESADKKLVVGYYWDCITTHNLKEVREFLIEFFELMESDINYSLSKWEEGSLTTKLIIYLNNDKRN